MKTLKKINVILLSVMLLLGTSACTDKSWALKTDSQTVSPGVYNYFVFEAYQQAVDKLSTNGDPIEDISGKTIDGKDAATWVKDTAVESSKDMLATEKLFKDKGLSLTEEETADAKKNTDTIWENSGTSFETKYSIDKESFHQAYSVYPLEMDKLFENIYGKDSSSKVSDEEILKFYNENYISVNIYSKLPFDGSSEDGKDHSNDTAEKIEEQFKAYTEMINSGAKSIAEVSEIIKQTDSLEANPFMPQYINKTGTDIPEQIKSTIVNLEPGKATYFKFNDIYFLFYKDTGDKAPIDLSNAEDKSKILYDMNSKSFEKLISDTKNSMQISTNEAVINNVDITKFKQ